MTRISGRIESPGPVSRRNGRRNLVRVQGILHKVNTDWQTGGAGL